MKETRPHSLPTCHFGGSRHFALAEKGASELQGYFGVEAE